jgi:hypothetical protein
VIGSELVPVVFFDRIPDISSSFIIQNRTKRDI